MRRSPHALPPGAASLALVLALACGSALPPPPEQPLAFNHRVHAGDNQIGCGTCHSYAAHGPAAGVPSAARCYGCHRFVDKEKPDVQRANAAFESGQPIQWIRVHRVPDHVAFAHQPHVAAGVRCQECHGQVEQMDVLRQVAPLTMGWCLDCHQRRRGPTDCLACHK